MAKLKQESERTVVVSDEVCEEIINPDGYHLGFYEGWCKACGICVAICPKDVFDRRDDGKPVVARPEDCTNCGLCEIMCPDFCIGWYTDPLCDEFPGEEPVTNGIAYRKHSGLRKKKIER
jgi:2-oxoglutarate ferredoxin oxidoreductase subunit delta